eukprot:2324124-Pyramimonas_sp.AAC.2
MSHYCALTALSLLHSVTAALRLTTALSLLLLRVRIEHQALSSVLALPSANRARVESIYPEREPIARG